MRLKHWLRWTGLATLICIAGGGPSTTETAPVHAASGGDHLERQWSRDPTVFPEVVRGGRGPEHCALSVGLFLGGALGFFANPFVGTAVMRLGFMAAALHCA